MIQAYDYWQNQEVKYGRDVPTFFREDFYLQTLFLNQLTLTTVNIFGRMVVFKKICLRTEFNMYLGSRSSNLLHLVSSLLSSVTVQLFLGFTILVLVGAFTQHLTVRQGGRLPVWV